MQWGPCGSESDAYDGLGAVGRVGNQLVDVGSGVVDVRVDVSVKQCAGVLHGGGVVFGECGDGICGYVVGRCHCYGDSLFWCRCVRCALPHAHFFIGFCALPAVGSGCVAAVKFGLVLVEVWTSALLVRIRAGAAGVKGLVREIGKEVLGE